MLDLNKIEKKIDAALARATEESIAEWYNKRRSKEIDYQLGAGEFRSLEGVNYSGFIIANASIVIPDTEIPETNDNFALAA